MDYILECEGFFIGEHHIPKFSLRNNYFYQINLPFTYDSFEDNKFLSSFFDNNNSVVKAYDTLPIYSGVTCRHSKGLLNLFKNRKVINRLHNFFEIDKNIIESLLSSNGLDKEVYWDDLALWDKVFLSFELAAINSTFVFFDTAGLGQSSVNKMFEYASKKRSEGYTIVHLDYPQQSFNIKENIEFLTIL